jgi:trehalose 6-phosphate synthase/phosphatase
MQRILIISNRLPQNLTEENGTLSVRPSVGGLATGLGSYYESHNCRWIGWPGIPGPGDEHPDRDLIREVLEERSCSPVFLTEEEIEDYYHGFANTTLWPLFHYFPASCSWRERWWTGYGEVNRAFCEAVADAYEPGDVIWVHDYHLMLLPAMIREEIPDATIGFFNHIPFPSYELFRILPWRREILEGLLGADLIGFHNYNYVRHFLDSVRRLLGYDHAFGEIITKNRMVRADTFPMGIDYRLFAGAAEDPAVISEAEEIRKRYGNRRILLSFDRLDYSKGIPQRLEAFDLFLEENPEYRGTVVLIVVAVPSRTSVTEYQALKQQVDELVGSITGKYGTMDWTPVQYFYHVLPFSTLVALYRAADVALVTPLRDGMNLMAKEYVATRQEGRGVLILSEMAGAANELGEALIINPFNTREIVDAILGALRMPETEQIERNRWMQQRLRRYDLKRWANDFLQRLHATKERQSDLDARRISFSLRERLLDDYRQSSRRLILLDYDGTLVPFASRPEKAVPDEGLITTLSELSRIPENRVILVSGRRRETLEDWFGDLGVGIIAEHGIWTRDRTGAWEMIKPLRNEWKEEIQPILERYVDRTPGSFIEEKEYSLVWHYRTADPDLATTRAVELKDMLLDLTAHKGLSIMEGSRVLEVKDASINKGQAALRWIEKGDWDFIMAIGDDWTDEYLFEVLPGTAYSIKVGMTPSRARFAMTSLQRVRELLNECIRCGREHPPASMIPSPSA